MIIVTGGDSNFYPFILSALSSLERSGVMARVDVGVIDQGLSASQREKLKSWGARLQVPECNLDVPLSLRTDCHLGLVARTELRDYFPGYNTYLCFDAGAWAQTDEFLDRFVAGARHSGIAVTPENGARYKRGFRDSRPLMCEPGRLGRPLSVLPLAGPDKTRTYTVPCHGQVALQTPLTFDAVCHL